MNKTNRYMPEYNPYWFIPGFKVWNHICGCAVSGISLYERLELNGVYQEKLTRSQLLDKIDLAKPP